MNFLNNYRKKGIITLSMLIVLTIAVGGIAACGKTDPAPAQKAEDDTKLIEQTDQNTTSGKEENVDAYIKSKGYKVCVNSGIGFDIYIPSKERESKKEFFDNLNEESRLNGYDFSSYLDKPLQYLAMAIESDDSSKVKDISFLCYQDKIVGVWLYSSNKEHLVVRGELLQYNFVYDSAEKLLQYKSPYIGDNSNAGNLMYSLPYVNGIKPLGCALQTDREPYGLVINCRGYGIDEKENLPYFFKNAAVIFSLIDNLGRISFNIESNEGVVPFTFSREEIEKYFHKDLREYAENEAEFEGFLMEVMDMSI